MLAQARVEEAKQLINEGKLSQRKIATLLGMSRATISAIASGKRPDYEARRRERGVQEEPLGPVERCPTCGARVFMPCRACRVRALKDKQQNTVRLLRRHARQQAIKRLLSEVARVAARDRESITTIHLPAAACDVPSDCK